MPSMWSALLIWVLACLVTAGCSRREEPAISLPPSTDEPHSAAAVAGPSWFSDVTRASGIDFTYRNGEEANEYTLLESLGGGVALLDYDRDGLLDIFLTGGGSLEHRQIKGCPCRLYRNLGGFHFKDVTAEAGLETLAGGQPWFYSHGAAVGDYDNDGWADLLVTGYGRLALFRNDHGKFRETTRAARLLPEQGRHWSTSAAWADLNADGRPDLVVAQYVDWSFANHIVCQMGGPGSPVDVCPPRPFAALPTLVYLNQGDGTFKEAGTQSGLGAGKGLGVVVLDLDEDGRPDIYQANDTSGNQLYLNKGEGKFEECALARGVDLNEGGLAAGSMGVDAADYDHSGHFSLFVTNFTQQSHALYHNDGKALFRHASVQAGITAIGQNFVGFGTAFLDYDRDGSEDLVIVNGHVLRHPAPPQTLAQRPVLLKNPCRLGSASRNVRYQDVSAQAGPFFQKLYRGRGLALGDLDNDGRLDLVVSGCNEPVVLLCNTVENGSHWLGVELHGAACPDATGAVLTLEAGGSRLLRAVKGGGSYLSANDRRVVFGLGGVDRVDRLTVRWPSGKTEVWPGTQLRLDHYQRLVEGKSPQ